MTTNVLLPRKALNKAFLKIKPNRTHIEVFKANLIKLLNHINEAESEEFHKNLISDFLKNTYYSPNHFINTKGRNDLVIHNGKEAKSTVGVIIEAKKPANKAEMLHLGNINTKALQELVLYYLRERVTAKNLDIKHLIATNINEWYIFDAQVFEKAFGQNKALIKQFTDFEEKRLASTNTDFFYKNIAEPVIEAVKAELIFTHFSIKDYEKPLNNKDKADDNELISLYKLFSPEHLLKLPFANDSNSLDKTFYAELLHIIGLTETKDGGKKLIERKKETDRNAGAILENAIIQLDSLDKISRLDKPMQFGANVQERLFNVGLELAITWINRVLFLKLLEAQLTSYHKGSKDYAFLNTNKVASYDNLNSLFFQVLAKKPNERDNTVKTTFANVPYLNSSLFEPTELEHGCLFISQLNDVKIPVLPATVLKDNTGKKRTGELHTLEYLFEFLNAYDFTSEGKEAIQEDNKRLINASVLGLIFEKINGYKDGSFFTPGFITMYMCRETLRRAVVQKFNETKGWNCKAFAELYDKIEDRKEANNIINSFKICDPAVGSGHFLVSALNELIAIKNDLRILQDHEGKRLKEYHVEVVNDELIVTDEDGALFDYNPNNKESQRIQETLFHEKQTIIENCLFGVDINPNSVKICRLRLWIELLKNTYYKNDSELETLPNIDINIKCGNSLISRFSLETDVKVALEKSKQTIKSYKKAVQTYRNAENKEQKRNMENIIAKIKASFQSEIKTKEVVELFRLKSEFHRNYESSRLFEVELTKAEKLKIEKKKEEDRGEISEKELEISNIKSNKIYENAFEWRFEFPEVLNDDGVFVGFDVVIGNPPYITKLKSEEIKFYQNNYHTIQGKKYDLFRFFYEKSLELLKKNGVHNFIVPDVILNLPQASILRKYLLDNYTIFKINTIENNPFEEAQLEPVITFLIKDIDYTKTVEIFDLLNPETVSYVNSELWYKDSFNFELKKERTEDIVISKLKANSHKIKDKSIWKKGLGVYSRQHLLLKFSQQDVEKIMKERPWTLDHKKDESFGRELEGKDVGRYSLDWNGGKWLSYGPWLAFQRPKEFFCGPRVLVREITKDGRYRVFSTYTEEEFYNNQSIFNGILKDDSYSLKFILGLINSSLFSYWQKVTSPKSERKLFPTLLMGTIEDFPLPECEVRCQQDLIALVNTALSYKTGKTIEDIAKLEKKIDQLVYELYGLTEEEIKIVEGA